MSQEGYSHLYTRIIQQDGLKDDLIDASSLLTSTEECSKNICLKLTNSKTVILDNPTKPKYPPKNKYPNTVKRKESLINAISFDAVQRLNARWLEYFRALLKENPNGILPSLAKADLHGAKMRVLKSKLPSIIGVSGYVLAESKSRFSIMTESREILQIGKIGSVFALRVDDSNYLVYGDQMTASSAGLTYNEPFHALFLYSNWCQLSVPGIRKSSMGTTLTNQDTALYDRQIRLYGLAAQQKIIQSKVAIYGEWNLITQEIVKNLCLNGLGSVHILSVSAPSASYVTLGIFGGLGDETQQKITDMNPGVDVKLHFSTSFDTLMDLQKSNRYSHIICTSSDSEAAIAIGELCRTEDVGFSWVFGRGLSAYLFNDFSEHTYFVKKKNPENNDETVLEEFCQFLSLRDSSASLNSIVEIKKNETTRISASMAAIIGAVSSQESIKLISAENRPINGLLEINGSTLEAILHKL